MRRRIGIADGQPVELDVAPRPRRAAGRGDRRVRPGNCFAPFHWNDEHGEYLTVNALTNDAVDADSLQPEFKVCAVSARPVGPGPGPHPGRRNSAVAAEGDGPLVLWASQTGNAEDFATRLARRLGDSQLVNMDDVPLSRLAAARDVLIVTSTFGDGGPPDNGAGFWDRLGAPDAPRSTACAMPCSASATAPMPTSAATPSRSTAGWPLSARRSSLDRAECEAYDRRADVAVGRPGRRDCWASSGAARAPTVDEPFTRADPVLAPLCRNTVLTAALSPKEVRQFGFDISEYDVGYAVGDSLGVCATNSPAVVDAWLAATGLRGDETVEVDGARQHAARRADDVLRHLPGHARPASVRRREQRATAAAKVLRAAVRPAGQVAGRPQRAGHRRGIHRACRARAMAGGAGAG